MGLEEAPSQIYPDWFDDEARKLASWAPTQLLSQIAAGSGMSLDSALAERALSLLEDM